VIPPKEGIQLPSFAESEKSEGGSSISDVSFMRTLVRNYSEQILCWQYSFYLKVPIGTLIRQASSLSGQGCEGRFESISISTSAQSGVIARRYPLCIGNVHPS
jgi:hypothetical protein